MTVGGGEGRGAGGGRGRRQKCRSAASASDQTGICTANVGTFQKKTGKLFWWSQKWNWCSSFCVCSFILQSVLYEKKFQCFFPYMFEAEGIAKKSHVCPEFVLTVRIACREYWMIYRGPRFSLFYDLTPLSPPPPSTGETQKDWERETTCWRPRGRG